MKTNGAVASLPAPLNALSYLTGVGSRGFVESLKSMLGGLARGRKVKKIGEGYQLREPSIPYGDHFEVEKDDIGPKSTYFWNDNIASSIT